jgi:hypothetical protein
MKKILTVIAIFISVNSYSQNLDTVNVSLTLRAQDWAWAVGKYGAGTDSISRARIRAVRTAILAANPAGWTTNVTINNVPGVVVMYLYNSFVYAPFSEVLQMGNTTAERTTIYTNIRAISNSALQYRIGVTDGSFTGSYLNYRNTGKSILMDN